MSDNQIKMILPIISAETKSAIEFHLALEGVGDFEFLENETELVIRDISDYLDADILESEIESIIEAD